VSTIHEARLPPSPRPGFPFDERERRRLEQFERAERAYQVARGALPFTVSWLIVHPSPTGLRQGLMFPVKAT